MVRPIELSKLRMKLGIRVFDKMSYEFSCVLQGDRHGKSPKEVVGSGGS